MYYIIIAEKNTQNTTEIAIYFFFHVNEGSLKTYKKHKMENFERTECMAKYPSSSELFNMIKSKNIKQLNLLYYV